jgi:hypothetical protein
MIQVANATTISGINIIGVFLKPSVAFIKITTITNNASPKITFVFVPVILIYLPFAFKSLINLSTDASVKFS